MTYRIEVLHHQTKVIETDVIVVELRSTWSDRFEQGEIRAVVSNVNRGLTIVEFPASAHLEVK